MNDGPLQGSRDPRLYRPNVGIALFSKRGHVFLGRRINAHGPFQWQMPQGGVDAGEDVEEAALRELQEEIGTDKADIIQVTPSEFYYDFPNEMRNHPRRGKWRGQRQRWVLARFTGTEDDVDLTADKHQEFGRWRWATADEVVNAIIPFKRAVYQAVLAELLDRPDLLEPRLE